MTVTPMSRDGTVQGRLTISDHANDNHIILYSSWYRIIFILTSCNNSIDVSNNDSNNR